jgi:plasmid stabilization system protein ParE
MFRVFVEAAALREIDAFIAWLAPLNPKAAAHHENALSKILQDEMRRHPNLFGHFWITGAPYRARLYSVSRRTKFWLVYRVEEDRDIVRVLRFWNASADPQAFEV